MAGIEHTDNILWLLKQAWYFSLTSVNDAVSEHGVSTAQIGVLRQLSDEPGLSGAELARRLLQWRDQQRAATVVSLPVAAAPRVQHQRGTDDEAHDNSGEADVPERVLTDVGRKRSDRHVKVVCEAAEDFDG